MSPEAIIESYLQSRGFPAGRPTSSEILTALASHGYTVCHSGDPIWQRGPVTTVVPSPPLDAAELRRWAVEQAITESARPTGGFMVSVERRADQLIAYVLGEPAP